MGDGRRGLKPLDKVFELLQPKGVEDRLRWLFRPGANQMRPNIDWVTQQNELGNRQTAAAENLLKELTSDQLFAFASTITMHHAFGAAIVKTTAKEEIKRGLMKLGLLADEGAHADVGIGILYGLKLQAGGDGDAWVRDLWRQAMKEVWGDRAEMRIVHCLPPTASTWADIEARSASLAESYWRTLPAFRIPDNADPAYIVDSLLAVGRSRDAVGWLGHNIKIKPSGALLIRVLRAAAKSDQQASGNDATMLSHWVATILNYLETAAGVSDQDIVGLQWMYFQALRYSSRPARTLHRALAHDPEFFVYLLKLIFLPAEDSGLVEPEPENLEAARILASQAYDVLHDWGHVPGADDQGGNRPGGVGELGQACPQAAGRSRAWRDRR